MIGIGITTTPNRQQRLAECVSAIKTFTTGEYALYVHNDAEPKGVTYSKNMCLHKLFEEKKCEHVFLFDDDCFPIKKGWNKFFPSKHVLFLNDKMHKMQRRKTSGHFNYEIYQECGGVFMSISRRDWQIVGYMDERYKLYGFEHAGYSWRIYRAWGAHRSLQGFGPYVSLRGMSKILFAHDYSEKKIPSSLNDFEKQLFLDHNRKVFIEEMQGNQFYKSFNP